MKKKFILPAAFALTLHAFLLVGLNDKPMPAAVATGDPLPKDKRDLLSLDTGKVPPENMDRGDETPSGGQAHATSRSWDITPVNFLPDAITIPRLPPVTGDHSTNVIPPDWQLPIGPGNPGIEVIDQSKLDRVPRARSQLAPIYPTDLRCAGVEGTVVVEFKVDLDGSVYSTTVLSATHSGFIDAALRAVGRWKFEPGCTAGKRVRFRMSVPLVFRIDGR